MMTNNFASGNKRRLNWIIRNTAFLTVAVGGVLSWGCFVFRDSILTFFIVLFVLHLFFGMYGILSAAPVTDALSVFAAYGLCRISLNDKAEGWSAVKHVTKRVSGISPQIPN